MIFRQTTSSDIPQIQIVRHAVKENRLSDPALVPDEDVEDFINCRGRGWVCVIDDTVVGFSIVDLQDNNVWALFLDPTLEGKGIGKKLHRLMLDWYFEQTPVTLWLGTAPGTRAEKFYAMQGWTPAGKHGNETKFEMTKAGWQLITYNS